MDQGRITDLLYQALETERGGTQVYETAIRCVVHPDLKAEWEEYLEQTRNHEDLILAIMERFDIDPEVDTPGRRVVRRIGTALVDAMAMALERGNPEAAQLVACECVAHAETKDHLDWELIHEVAEHLKGDLGKVLTAAFAEVEAQEDEHLYHTAGWCRELWIASLGLPAVLPPPEEEKHVRTAIGAARARKDRKRML